VDDALRRLERGGDPLAYATALRRAGDDVRARRVVEARVRAGDAAAREVLDAWWPVDERVLRVIARARLPDQFTARVLTWLVAEEDPRLEPAIDSLTTHWLETFGRHPSADRARVADLAALLRSPADERRRVAVAKNDLWWLSRARLDADEAERLLSRALGHARGENASRDERRSLLLTAIWQVGKAGAVQCAPSLSGPASSDDRLIAFEAASALRTLGVDGPVPAPALLEGRAFRPGSVADRSPGEMRDRTTRVLLADVFMNDPWAPLESDEAGDAPLDGWLLVVVGPQLNVVASRVARALQSAVGDRVGLGRDRMIRLEPDLDPLPIADGVRAAIAAVGVKASIGVARGTTWARTIVAASAAATVAQQEGGDRVRLAP
jgi:hypothetical protein